MAKSRKNSKSVLKSISKTSQKALPAVNKGLQNVGIVAKKVAQKSIPVVEKGVSAVYGTMATGFDLGVKGVAKGIKVAKSFKKSRSAKRHRKSRKTRKH
jgi:hypothetical protein